MKKQYIIPSTRTLPIAPLTRLMAASGGAVGFSINGGYVNPADAGTGV